MYPEALRAVLPVVRAVLLCHCRFLGVALARSVHATLHISYAYRLQTR